MKTLKLEKIIEYGIYLFVFLLPWQTHLVLREGAWHGNFGGSWPVDYWRISLYGVNILLAVLLVLSAIFRFKNKKVEDKKIDWLWLFLSVLDVGLFISIFFAPDKILAIYKYIVFLLGLGLFWILSLKVCQRGRILAAWWAAAVLQSFLALWQFLSQSSFASKWLGMAAHNGGQPGASVVEFINADGKIERWLRAYGSFDHPNILGGFLTLSLLFLLADVLKYQRKKSSASDWGFILRIFSLITIFIGLLLTFSRSAFLAFAIGSLVIIIFFLKSGGAGKIIKAIKVLVLMTAVFAMLFFPYKDLFLTRTTSSQRLEIKSISERELYWRDGLRIAKDEWLVGAGIGNFTKESEQINKERSFWQWQPVHNVFLLVLSEGGVLSLLGFIWFWFFVFYLNFKKKNFINLSVWLSLSIMMLVDHYYWSLHAGLLIFFLASGIVVNEEDKK
jgi:hypothetical protein